jgi:hypothetical protein
MTRNRTPMHDPASIEIQQEPSIAGQFIVFLEPDQLVSDAAKPVARAILTTRMQVALWALRAFTVIVATAVVYAFVAELVR